MTILIQRVSRYSLVLGLLCILVNPGKLLASDSLTPTLASSDPHPEVQVQVNIRARVFHPDTIRIRSGEKIRLVLRNEDAELHAFVPISLFSGSTLNVSGNGAPQFGPEGFRRVLLPSRGQTEILFIPQRPGTYPFFCDLPGHKMNGRIVVSQ